MTRPAGPSARGVTALGSQSIASQVPRADGCLAIVGPTLIDATSMDQRPDQTVVVRDGRISQVGRAGEIPIPSDATVLDGAGQFLIPGLWDMHVHQFDPRYLEVHLRQGVTGIRHMSGIPQHHDWRRQVADGALLGPRTILSSPIFDGPTPLRPGSIAVHSAQGARAAIGNCHDADAEFIKIYDLVPRDAFDAIVRECSYRQIPFVGHVPLAVGLIEAIDGGQASIEHLAGMVIASATRPADYEHRLRQLDARTLADMAQVQELSQQAELDHDPTRLADICDHLIANGTWITPTLAVLQASALAGTDSFPLTDYLPWVEPYLRLIWEGAIANRASRENQARARRTFEFQVDIVHRLYNAGVRLLAGTDTFVPGFSLHDELALLVDAGLSPWEAIRTATHDAATFLGAESDIGTIETGKLADLVLLGQSPLHDIANSRSIAHTIIAGHVIHPELPQSLMVNDA